MKKASKEAYAKDIKGKILYIGNTFLTKGELSTHEIKRVLSLPIRHLNIDVLFVPTGLKKNRTRMLKSLSTEKMLPDDKNVFASNAIDKYENRSDNPAFNVLSRFCVKLCQQRGR